MWNRLPAEIREQIVTFSLKKPELSPLKLAVRFTDEQRFSVSEAAVDHPLEARDLITSPAYIVVEAADEFRDKTSAPNQLWQTDCTDLKVVGKGRYYLSTVLDDVSRTIVAWKLCPTMQASDVTATRNLAPAAAGLDQRQGVHRPRLLFDNGPSYVASDLADWLGSRGMTHIRGAPHAPQAQGRTERRREPLKNRILLQHAYPAGDLEAQFAAFVEHPKPPDHRHANRRREEVGFTQTADLEIALNTKK